MTSEAEDKRRGRFEFFDLEPGVVDMRDEVLGGLREPQKRLAPKYFYDETGSQLFEAITRLPEYYLTRAELALFEAHLDELVESLGAGVCLVEYGSGSSLKIRTLLRRARPAAYVPVDISAEHLVTQARAVHRDHPWLDVFPTCADFTTAFPLPAPARGLTRTGFFPGSSIGNFDVAGAVAFLRNARTTLGTGAHLLVGVDRKKPREVLEAAYNDSAGVTARFNLNVLAHINHRLDADFDLDAFEHEAGYDADAGCIRMFLRSREDQRVRIGDVEIEFAAGERIHTENSHKYDLDEFRDLAGQGGFAVTREWTDGEALFAMFLLTARG